MAGRQRLRAHIARRLHQVGELHPLVAAHAGNGRLAFGVGLDKIGDHALAEALFVIEHVMGDAELLGDALGVVDVLPRAARAFAPRRARVVKLQSHADHLVPVALEQRGGHGGIDAA